MIAEGSVTINEAMAKGRRMIVYPFFAISFGTVAAFAVTTILFHIHPALVVPSFFVGMAFALLNSWLVQPKWCLWAFENVAGVHELRKKAIRAKFITAKTDIIKCIQRNKQLPAERLAAIQEKFRHPDLFIDNYAIPEATIIQYGKKPLIISVIIAVPFMVFVLFWIGVLPVRARQISTLGILLGLLPVTFFLIALIKGLRRLFNTKPQLIISNNGIYTSKNGQAYWRNITEENIVIKSSGKSSYTYLTFQNNGVSVKINVDFYDIETEQLADLLTLYRGRYETAHSL